MGVGNLACAPNERNTFEKPGGQLKNRFDGFCHCCFCLVRAGTGVIEKPRSTWVVKCARCLSMDKPIARDLPDKASDEDLPV
jgi:hypothetical protein